MFFICSAQRRLRLESPRHHICKAERERGLKMRKTFKFDSVVSAAAFGAAIGYRAIVASSASAATLPWVTPIVNAYETIQGPVATAVAGMVMIGAFLAYAMGESQGMGKRGLQLVIGVSGALMVSNVIDFIVSD